MNYENIDFIPIDLPKIPIPTTLTWLENNESWAWWNFIRLTEKTKNYQESNWIDIPEWQWIRNWITDNIPIYKLVQVKVNNQLEPAKFHIDFTKPDNNPELYNHNKSLEPCGYRIVLSGRRDGVVIGNNKNTYLPLETDVYCIRHTETLHATLEDNNRTMVFIHCWIDKDKHYKILDRSIKKYKDYIVYKD